MFGINLVSGFHLKSYLMAFLCFIIAVTLLVTMLSGETNKKVVTSQKLVREQASKNANPSKAPSLRSNNPADNAEAVQTSRKLSLEPTGYEDTFSANHSRNAKASETVDGNYGVEALESPLLAESLTDTVNDSEDFSDNNNVQDLEDLFQRQDINFNWALDEEYRYISIFSEQESLSNFALRSSECRENICKVVVATAQHGEQKILTQALANALLQEKDSFGITLPTRTNGEVEFYISDNNTLMTEQSP